MGVLHRVVPGVLPEATAAALAGMPHALLASIYYSPHMDARYTTRHTWVRSGLDDATGQCKCDRGAPSPGPDVAGVGPVRVQMSAGVSAVPEQMWHGASRSRSPTVAEAVPVPVQTWEESAQSRCGCGEG
jgi:hypothetical protein